MAGGESQIAILDDAPETADGHHLSDDQDQTRSENGGAQVLPFTRTEPNAERMVLDRLPLGVIIYSDDGILYANHAALDLSGRSNVPALKELGQIEALFADGMDEGNGAMTLVRPDGSTLQVTGRVQSVRWDGQSAALLSLREHTPADSETQEASQDASLLAAGAAGVAAGAIAGANAADGALPSGARAHRRVGSHHRSGQRRRRDARWQRRDQGPQPGRAGAWSAMPLRI
jgi:hypothetical protein